MKTMKAVAMGPCVGTLVTLRLENGSERQLSVPGALCRHFQQGQRVVLYYDAAGELAGWDLPDEGIGVDLRS
jgi:YD repeat-containing protein